MIVAEILFFVCAFSILNFFWRNRKFIYLASKIPNSTLNLQKLCTTDHKKIFRELYEHVKNYPDLSKLWFGPILFVTPTKPEFLNIIFNSKDCIDKPYFKRFFELDGGSLFGEPDLWQRHRKILNSFFKIQSLQSVVPVFNSTITRFLHNIQKLEGKGEFNIFHNMSALTLETILQVMDYDANIQNQKSENRDYFIKNLEK